jgi:hypothetical protein
LSSITKDFLLKFKNNYKLIEGIWFFLLPFLYINI